MKRVVMAGPKQPQENHETTGLELSRVGESLDGSVFEGTLTFQKSHCGFFDGNKTKLPQKQDVEETMWVQ